MGTELRQRYDSVLSWVKSNINIPQSDAVDGIVDGKGVVPTDGFGEISFLGATRKARAKVKYNCLLIDSKSSIDTR